MPRSLAGPAPAVAMANLRDFALHGGANQAVLEMLGRFSEDLTVLQRAIRFGDGETLFRLFTEARAVRRVTSATILPATMTAAERRVAETSAGAR